jgi:hypothetical protein
LTYRTELGAGPCAYLGAEESHVAWRSRSLGSLVIVSSIVGAS